MVEIGANKSWLAIITLKDFTSITEKVYIIVTFYLVVFNLRLTWKIVKFILRPVLRFLDLTFEILCWPHRKVIDFIFNTIQKYRQAKQWVLSRPQVFEDMLNGNYAVNVNLANGVTVKVSLMEKLDEILAFLRGKTTLEMAQQGSTFTQFNVWPKGLVVVRDGNGMAQGMGFLQVFRNKWTLVTCSHVLLGCKTGIVLSAGIDQKHVSITKDAKVVLESTSDVVVVEIPYNTAASLAVQKPKMGKTPGKSVPVTTFGYVLGKFVQSIGVISDATVYFGFKHTASTIRGFSGTPIWKDDVIVGIHSRANGSGSNFGLSLDFLLGQLESVDYTSERFLRKEQEDEIDDQEEDVIAWQWEQEIARKGKSSDHFWSQRADEREWHNMTVATFRWTDDSPMDFERDPYYEDLVAARKREEAKKQEVFQKSPSNGASLTTSGNVIPSESKATTSCTVESTTTTLEEAQRIVRLHKKSMQKSKRSEIGIGQVELSTKSAVASECMPTSSQKESGNQKEKGKSGSLTKSVTAVATQIQPLQTGTKPGNEEFKRMWHDVNVKTKEMTTELSLEKPSMEKLQILNSELTQLRILAVLAGKKTSQKSVTSTQVGESSNKTL
jgi:hypothetical protein